MKQLFDIENKVAFVTGGSRGLGLAIARGLADCGAKVGIAARNPPPHTALDGLTFFQSDLLHREGRVGLIDQVVNTMGGIDIFVHCAGQQHRQSAVHYPLTAFEELYELHVVAGMDIAQQCAAHMLPRNDGKIIFISSILGYQGGVTVPAYSAAKHAMLGVVKALSNEWASHGVNVNAIAPGYMNTEMVEALMNDPQRGPAILARIPAKRLGHPDELIGAVVFLSSAASSYVHGHSLVVDGGWMGR